MKKNLRNILVLAMGLMTTVSFAQDWNVDSRTRIDMNENAATLGEDEMSTDQRVTLGATWGGSDWGIHVSSDVNYTFDIDGRASMGIYEAYASTDVMGYASLTAGRQALDFGSGAIMSSNHWGAVRSTWDGFNVGLDLDMADITLGYGNTNVEGDETTGTANYWLNAAKGDGDWTANLLYMSSTTGTNDAITAMGLDVSYAMMGGDLNLNGSYNTSSGYSQDALGASLDGDMMSFGATYSVNESMSVTGNLTQYGENGFDVGSANMQGYANSGSLGYLGADEQDMNFGISYNMGDFNLSATMHKITNEGDDAAGTTTKADYSRDVTDIALGYTMSDNANLSIHMATDKVNDDEDVYMWVTLNIRP
jgi:hypothetical protein